MKSLLVLSVILASSVVFAEVGDDENLSDQVQLAEIEIVTQQLAALNHTVVHYDPNARHSPIPTGLFEDESRGQWVLGNGGKCVRAKFSRTVVCDGATGFTLSR